MKNLLFTLFAIAICYSASEAQIGIRAGFNSATITIDFEDGTLEPDSRAGFHLGIVYDVAIGNNLTFRPGALYSTKGFKFGETSLFGESDTQFTYLDIPLHIVYKFGTDPAKGFFLNGGPTVSLLMSASDSGDDVKEFIKSTDFGFNLGLGYQINTNFHIGLDATVGLSDLPKEADDDLTFKNQVGSLYLIYKI